MILEQGIKLPFVYAAGAAASAFLIALRDEARLLGSACTECGHVSCPASSSCARCGNAEHTRVPVGPEGVVVSWTRTASGEVFGLVRPDGCDGALLHRLLGDSWAIDDRVRAVFEAERVGHITDLRGFERLDNAAPLHRSPGAPACPS